MSACSSGANLPGLIDLGMQTTSDAGTADLRGADLDPESARRVFVTSNKVSARFELTNAAGASDADAHCMTSATGAGLGGTWRAWISDSTHDAIDRIADVAPWDDLQGARIFATKAELMANPRRGIAIDEYGALVASDRVWTGTDLGGHYAVTDGACANWSSTQMGDTARIGQVGRFDGGAWTAYSATTCNQLARLICLEQ